MPDPLRDWSDMPKWVQEAYCKDLAAHKIIKDWRMTNQPIAILYEKLAIKMYELKNFWQATAENKIEEEKSTKESILDKARQIINSDISWDDKYDRIFSPEIAVAFRNQYPEFGYYDPDTTQEEDVTAWFNAAERYIKCLNPKGDWVFQRSSGFAGYRCRKCAVWVYADNIKVCNCDS